MLILIIFQHLMVYECWYILQFFGHGDVSLPKPWHMLYYSVVKADDMPWQILLAYDSVADGKPQRQML